MRKEIARALLISAQLAALTLTSGFTDCAPPDAPSEVAMRATLLVRDELGLPVAGASFATAERALGQSAADGRLTISLRGHESARVAVQTQCPPGSHLEGEAPSIPLRQIAASSESHAARGVEVAVRCASDLRRAALVVNANGRAGLPILVQGVERARTGPDGLSHLLLPLDPKEEVQVTIDTTSHPALKPQRPSRVFAMGMTDSLFLFDQAFTDPTPAPAPKKRRRPPPPASEPQVDQPDGSAVPYRLN